MNEQDTTVHETRTRSQHHGTQRQGPEGVSPSEHVYLDQLELLTQLALTPATPSARETDAAP
jgi:hypothetical protein